MKVEEVKVGMSVSHRDKPDEYGTIVDICASFPKIPFVYVSGTFRGIDCRIVVNVANLTPKPIQ